MTELDGKLAEYQTLRQEILQNDKMIQVMSLVALFGILIPLGFSGFMHRPDLLVFCPVVYFIYLQMVMHKLEGTVRIASYISVFLEPELPGLGWETSLAQLRDKIKGMPGIPTHTILLYISVLGAAIPSLFFLRNPATFLTIGIALFVSIYAVVQIEALKHLSSSEGFANAWNSLKE
jgi:hypothetical protein